MIFEKEYFYKISKDAKQLDNYLASAKEYLSIAKQSKVPEVIFQFAYDALLKLGIYLIAKEGYRIRSIPGHHSKILKTISELLHNKDIFDVGEILRKRRNSDLYDASKTVTMKYAKEALVFIEVIFKNI